MPPHIAPKICERMYTTTKSAGSLNGLFDLNTQLSVIMALRWAPVNGPDSTLTQNTMLGMQMSLSVEYEQLVAPTDKMKAPTASNQKIFLRVS